MTGLKPVARLSRLSRLMVPRAPAPDSNAVLAASVLGRGVPSKPTPSSEPENVTVAPWAVPAAPSATRQARTDLETKRIKPTLDPLRPIAYPEQNGDHPLMPNCP